MSGGRPLVFSGEWRGTARGAWGGAIRGTARLDAPPARRPHHSPRIAPRHPRRADRPDALSRAAAAGSVLDTWLSYGAQRSTPAFDLRPTAEEDWGGDCVDGWLGLEVGVVVGVLIWSEKGEAALSYELPIGASGGIMVFQTFHTDVISPV